MGHGSVASDTWPPPLQKTDRLPCAAMLTMSVDTNLGRHDRRTQLPALSALGLAFNGRWPLTVKMFVDRPAQGWELWRALWKIPLLSQQRLMHTNRLVTVVWVMEITRVEAANNSTVQVECKIVRVRARPAAETAAPGSRRGAGMDSCRQALTPATDCKS